MRTVFICSTNGSVIKKAFYSGLMDKSSFEIVSDRECGVIDFARNEGLTHTVLKSKSGGEFSRKLFAYFSEDKTSLFVSFYTRLLRGDFLKEYEGRLVNLHPSILPACPGMNGFEDMVRSGSMFVGSTVHFIDSGMDTGYPIMQAAFPKNPKLTSEKLRHRVFLQQCISLLQIIKWFRENRMGNARAATEVTGASYTCGEFSPNLDDDLIEVFRRWTET